VQLIDHFICQNSIETVLVEGYHPIETTYLIVTHLAILNVCMVNARIEHRHTHLPIDRLTPRGLRELRDGLGIKIVLFQKLIILISFTESVTTEGGRGRMATIFTVC
jgi:hypothetical protein